MRTLFLPIPTSRPASEQHQSCSEKRQQQVSRNKFHCQPAGSKSIWPLPGVGKETAQDSAVLISQLTEKQPKPEAHLELLCQSLVHTRGTRLRIDLRPARSLITTLDPNRHDCGLEGHCTRRSACCWSASPGGCKSLLCCSH